MNRLAYLLALASIACVAQAKMICLVTHITPTEEERKLLAEPEGSFREAAERAGYVVTETGLALVARPKNLYNLDYMDQVMQGYAALRSMAVSGSPYRKLSEMSGNERQGVRAILGDSTVMSSYGPLAASDDTSVKLWAKRSITLTNGRREVTVRLPEPSPKEPDDFLREAPSSEEVSKFKDREIKKYQKQSYPDALLFTFRSSDEVSVLRTNTVVDVAKELSDLLETQRKAFVSARNALLAGLMNDNMPKDGASWLTLDDTTQRFLTQMKDQNYSALGFDSKEDADKFFFDARVRSSKVDAFVSIGVKNVNGLPLVIGTSVDVKRNN